MEFKPHPLKENSRLWHFREHLPEQGSMYWLYDTYGPVIEDVKYNRGCFDVSKSRVHKIHLEALGYSAAIDPRTYPLPFMEKPERQCLHDQITVRTRNQEPRPGFVYEKLLDNSTEFRYFYCRTGTDFFCEKKRKPNEINTYKIIKVVEKGFHPDFIERFCNHFGIDFAELDIMYREGVPYITDVNNIAGLGMTPEKFDNIDLYNRVNDLYREHVKSL